MCESLEYLLKTMDYNVTTANCGQDALALIAENAFDLAVLDIQFHFAQTTYHIGWRTMAI